MRFACLDGFIDLWQSVKKEFFDRLRGVRKDAPFCYLAATAVVVTAAAIATAQERTAAAIAQNENQNDDPANVSTTEAIIVAHKNDLQGFFGAV